MLRNLYEKTVTSLERAFNFDARYFVRGGFWLFLGQVVITLLGLITTVLFANVLDEAVYGVYRYLIGLAVIFSTFSLTGLGQAILQTAAIGFSDFYRKTIRTNFVYSIGIVLLGLIGFGYYLLNDNATLALGCLLIAFLQPVINSFQFVPTYLQGAGKFKESTVLHSVKSIAVSTASIIAVLLTQNVLWLFCVYLLSNAIANVVSHRLFRPSITNEDKPALFTKYLRYAKHTSLRYLILNASFRADSVIVFTQLGAVELAVYTIAMIIPEQIKSSFKALSTLLIPKFAKRAENGDVTVGITKRSVQLFFILLLAAVVYIILSPLIYKLVFPKYEEAIFLSQILALSFPAMVALIPSSALEARLREKELYWYHIINSLALLVLTLIGVALFGLIGAIIGKVISRYINMLLAYAILYLKRTA